MANDDLQGSPAGSFLPVQYPYGNYRKTLYRVNTGVTAYYIGMPVQFSANGYVGAASGGADKSAMLGTIVGFLDLDKAGLPKNLTDLNQAPLLDSGTTTDEAGYVMVADDPNQIFQIQADTGGSAMTVSAIPGTSNWTYSTASGNTVTGYSKAMFDRSEIAADTTGTLQILGLADRMNSDGTPNDWGNHCKILVRIMYHQLGDAGAGHHAQPL